MKEEIIKDGENLIAKICRNSDWPEHLNFYTADTDFVQVSTWNYNKDKHLKAHGHKIAERKSNRTQEVIFVKSGKLKVVFYSEDDKQLYNGIMEPGDFAIIFAGGHANDILKDKTQILEIKNGPYLGLEVDKKVIE